MIEHFLHYDEPVFRPPSEARSLIIQVTLGCSVNSCTFCEMYTSKKFRTRAMSDIAADLRAAARSWPDPEKVFLADGDALVLPAAKLKEICDLIFELFPDVPKISAYAAPRNLTAKSPKDLKSICAAGISLIYYGVESGHDAVLEKVRKGATAREIGQGLSKAHDAGFKTSVTWILGLGGRRYSAAHARETAALISKCGPAYSSALTLMLPFGEERFKRAFPEWEEITPMETLEELRIFVEGYDGPPTIFRSNHASNYLPLRATLPADRKKILDTINSALKDPKILRPEWSRGL